MLAPEQAARRLIALADRVRNLSVRRRSPDAFFEERSEIDSDMRKLAEEISGRGARSQTDAKRSAFKAGAIAHAGKLIAVEKRAPRAARRPDGASLADTVFSRKKA